MFGGWAVEGRGLQASRVEMLEQDLYMEATSYFLLRGLLLS
jgi:hypothetical protein